MRVTFHPLGTTAESKANETVLDAARRAGAPLGNSCGGIGICARCRVRVLSGVLSQPTEVESRMAREKSFDANERLACQAVVLGDCVITASYW